MTDYSDIIGSTFGQQNPALPTTVGNIDEDPDKAQRAIDLSKATGVAPTSIYGDLEEFERQHKAVLASDIVANNPHLSDYVQSNPMAAKISNDDYGQLDTVSSKVSALQLPQRMRQWLDSTSIADNFKAGFGSDNIGSWLQSDDIKNHPIGSAVLAGLGTPIELALRAFQGATHAGLEEVSAGLTAIGGEQFGRDITGMAEAELFGLTGRHGLHGPAPDPAARIRPYVENGREPLPTILPEYDKFRADQNKDDVDALKEATSESQASLTRERAPDMFRGFIAQHTDAEIGVSGDAVSALYGDKVPAPDDGLLGWVPGIEDKLALAKETGSDVSVPLANWLTHAEPEVMQALHDDLRVRPGGITANEVKLAAEAKEGLPEGVKPPGEAPINEDVPSLRAATALEPLFSVGDRKLELQRMVQKAGSNFTEAQGFHDFNMVDENGRTIGALNISEQKGGKELYVDNITGVNGLGPRDFGPALMRSVKQQLKAEFPNAEWLVGHRVSGARERAGKEMTMPEARVKLDNPAGWDTVDVRNEFSRILEGGQWETYSPHTKAYIKPFAERNLEDQHLIDVVNRELDKIVPNKVAVQEADRIIAGNAKGQSSAVEPTGIYIRYKETYPIILYSMEGVDPLGTARHEAIHHLRNYGFFKPEEWATLEKAADEQGWMDKYSIADRYPAGDRGLRLEESIADAYKDWEAGRFEEVTPETRTVFEKMKAFFDAIREQIAKLFGKDATWEDIFQKVSTGEVGGREGTEPLDPRAYNESLSVADPSQSTRYERAIEEFQAKNNLPPNTPEQMFKVMRSRVQQMERERRETQRIEGEKYPPNAELAELRSRLNYLTRQNALGEQLSVEEPQEGGSRVFERASALGMTVDQFKAYDRLMQKRHEEDIAAANKRVDDFQRKAQTKEWKDNRRELRADISKEIHQRPDVAADLFFSTGELYGHKIATGYKLDTDQLSPEQRQAIPKDYQARGGLNPDDVANIFGYGSGDAMLQRLAEYNAAKKASGLGAKDFVARVTDAEADRQMRLRHGVLEDNIVDSVKEQVASETQLDILHEETVALGMRTKQAPLDKSQILKDKRAQLGKMQLGSFSSDRFMADAGKAGKAVELAHLKGAPAEAFKEKQRQYYSTILANEAIKTEKALERFNKIANRFSKREVATVDQAYTNFIHDILMRVGKPVRRSIQDLESEIQAGEYKSLQAFVNGKETHALREVPVADILLDPSFRKKFEDLTVDEFNATNDSIKTLVQNGRDEKKINKAGEAFDLNEVKQQMIDQLAATSLEPKKYDAKGKRTDTYLPKFIRSFSMNIMQLETLFNRFDEGNAQGPFQQFIMRDLADASSNEGVLRKKYAAMVKAIDDKADLKKAVDNTIFKVPDSDQLMKFNRENLRAVLLNMGNESNMSKLARGYGIEPTALWDWIGKHATKEDWDWAQKMGDVFAEIKKEADTMYRNLSGVAPASLDIKPVQTLHGEYPGWYYPIINHPEFEGKSKKLMGPNALEGEGFVRATTPSGYTKGRTGYAGPMALDLDALPSRMTQMLHDIAMRPAVINASKMFYDKDFRSAISKYYNTEAKDMLIPYLQSVANSANYIPKNQKDLANLSEFARQNMINTLVGLNPGTVLKHGPTAAIQSLQEVGVSHFLKAIKGLFSVNESTGESNWQFAMKTFDELQLRHRNYEETLGGAMNEIAPQGQFMSLRQAVQKFASAPVALSDLLSAVPMALAQYSKSMEEGLSHGDAVFMANRAVRRAHGSMAITNRSAIQRVGPLGQWLVSVYGFFNHIANRQYELAWKSGDALGLAKDGEYKEAMSRVPEITAKLFAYVIAPAMIEQMVTPLEGSDKDSFVWKAAKGIAFTLGASWPVVRDIVAGLTGGRDPSVGLLTTAGKAITDVGRDIVKDHPLSKEHAGKVIRDGSVLLGMGTGIIPGQVGKTAQFGQRVATGQERPKGPWGWMVGARFGTLKNHSGTFQEYMRHH